MSGTGSSNDGFASQKTPTDSSCDFNVVAFIVSQLLGRVRTIGLGKVKTVTHADEVATPPIVDVQIVINMLDGVGQATEHQTVFGLPYIRLQGGLNAVLTPPAKDDFVVVLVADRDISTFKKNKDISNPGSFRRFDLADGIAIGGICNAAPTQYLRFKLDGDGNPAGVDLIDALGNDIKTSSDGINIDDVNGNTIVTDSDGVKINGVLFDRSQNISAAAKIDATDEITAKSGGAGSVTLTEHQHGTGSPAAGTTAPTGGT